MLGADDPAILRHCAVSAGCAILLLVRQAFADIEAEVGGAFAALIATARGADQRLPPPPAARRSWRLRRLILGAYYRDDRVLLSLKQEARAPFPKGYTLEQGDWSLLDAVRDRLPLWRDDRKELAK